MAASGPFMNRWCTVEEPVRGLPGAGDPGEQTWFEVSPGEDPLLVADRIGRPVAILRMGGRLPGVQGPDSQFLFGSPQLVFPDSQP